MTLRGLSSLGGLSHDPWGRDITVEPPGFASAGNPSDWASTAWMSAEQLDIVKHTGVRSATHKAGWRLRILHWRRAGGFVYPSETGQV